MDTKQNIPTNKDGGAPQASQNSGKAIAAPKPQADGSGTNVPVEGSKHMSSFDGNRTLFDGPSIFRRSSTVQRSPPPLSQQSAVPRDAGHLKVPTEEEKNAALQTEDNATVIAPIFMLLKDEDQQLQVCKDAISAMKRATHKQRNISMEVKNGLCKLEEAIDILSMLKRKRWRDYRRDSQTESLTSVDTDVAPSTVNINKRRASSSPKNKREEKKNKQENKGNPEGVGPDSEKRKEKGEELEPWTVVRSRKTPAKKKRRRNRPRKPKIKPEALLIKTGKDQTYAQVLGTIRDKVNPEASDTEIKSVRRTRISDILLEFGANTGNKGTFCEA